MERVIHLNVVVGKSFRRIQTFAIHPNNRILQLVGELCHDLLDRIVGQSIMNSECIANDSQNRNALEEQLLNRNLLRGLGLRT